MEKNYLDEQELDDNEELEDGLFSKIRGFFGSFMDRIGYGSAEEDEDIEGEELVVQSPALKINDSAKTSISKYNRKGELFEFDDNAKTIENVSSVKIVDITPERKNEIVFHISNNVFDNEVIADYLSQGKTCIVRFDETDMGDFETSYNYLLGAMRATKGNVKKICDFLYIFSSNESVVIPASESINIGFRKADDFNVKIVDVENYNVKEELSNYLKANIPVIMRLDNFQDIVINDFEDLVLTRRDLFEFVKGASFIIDSKILKLENLMYLIYPKNIKVMQNSNSKVVVDNKKVTNWNF